MHKSSKCDIIIYVTPCLYHTFWRNGWCDIIEVRVWCQRDYRAPHSIGTKVSNVMSQDPNNIFDETPLFWGPQHCMQVWSSISRTNSYKMNSLKFRQWEFPGKVLVKIMRSWRRMAPSIIWHPEGLFESQTITIISALAGYPPRWDLSCPPAWMDAVGVHVPSRRMFNLQYLLHNIFHGTSNQALRATC